MGTKRSCRTHSYGAPIQGNIGSYIFKPIDNDNQILVVVKYSSIRYVKCFDTTNKDVCRIPCLTNSYIEGLSLGMVYNTGLDSDEGGLRSPISQKIYISKINKKKIFK